MITERNINRWTSEVTRTDEQTGERKRLIVYSVDAGNWRVRSNNLVTLRSGIKLRSEAVARAAAIVASIVDGGTLPAVSPQLAWRSW